MNLLRINGAPTAQFASPMKAICGNPAMAELKMIPSKYKLCFGLSFVYPGCNVVGPNRVVPSFWRLSTEYRELLSLGRGHGRVVPLSVCSLASMSFPVSRFSTWQLPEEKRKRKLLAPKVAGTSLQDYFKPPSLNIEPT